MKMQRARALRGPFFSRRSPTEWRPTFLKMSREIAEFLAAGRRRLRHEVEDLAVLDAVIGEPRDAALLVEIDRDDALVHTSWGMKAAERCGFCEI